jgi:hypothetical protein
MKKYIISILPIILLAVSFPSAQAVIQFSDASITTSNSSAYDSLVMYNQQVEQLQAESDHLVCGIKTQADRMKYYGVLRDLARAKSAYYQQLACVNPDRSSLAKTVAWHLIKQADSLQSHIYAMSSETQPKVTVGGKMSMSKELQDMFR